MLTLWRILVYIMVSIIGKILDQSIIGSFKSIIGTSLHVRLSFGI